MPQAVIEENLSTTGELLLTPRLQALRDDIIGPLLPMAVSPDMTIAELRAVEALLSLRLELAHLNYELAEPACANLYYHRAEQIEHILTLQYHRSLPVDRRIEILELLRNIRLSLTAEDSSEVRAEAVRLQTRGKLTEFQQLRISLLQDTVIEQADKTVADMLPKVKNSFDFGTLSGLFDVCTSDIRTALQAKFEQLLTVAFDDGDSDVITSLLSQIVHFNTDPVIAEKHQASINNLFLAYPTLHHHLPRPISLLNATAAQLHARIAASPASTPISSWSTAACNAN